MIVTKRISVASQGDCQIIDINDEVCRQVAQSGVANGIVTVFVLGTTAGVAIMEFEPGLVSDLQAAMERLAPRGLPYQHNILNNDDNGHAHTQATFVGPSMVVPFSARKPLLGTWQRIILVDFDSRPRTREVILQIMGE